jgi:hypothetical protein
MTEGLRVVRDGLHEGDVIVVGGLQRVRPGSPVTPKKVSMASQPNSLGETSAQSAPVGNEEKSSAAKARE